MVSTLGQHIFAKCQVNLKMFVKQKKTFEVEKIKLERIIIVQGPYSQHFIFFLTYDCVQWATTIVPGKPVQPTVLKHSSLLGTFLS